jgi:hypothetical protein
MKKHIAVFVLLASVLVSVSAFAESIPKTQWENYVSRHYTFTLLKPVGWIVKESYKDSPKMWTFSVTEPNGRCQVTASHGVSPKDRDADSLIRTTVADLSKQTPGLQFAPTARRRSLNLVDATGKKTGEKIIVVFEGTYTSKQNQKRQFRRLVTAGNGLVLHQRIEAAEGHLGEAAPILLQILANLRVAKGIYAFDEGSQMAQPAQGRPQPMPMKPQQLASGWAKFSAPPGWQKVDLGKGACIVTDPAQRLYFMVAGAEFVAPRYYVRGVPGVLMSEFRAPSDAFAFSAAQTGRASNFRFLFIKKRPDLLSRKTPSRCAARTSNSTWSAAACRITSPTRRPARSWANTTTWPALPATCAATPRVSTPQTATRSPANRMVKASPATCRRSTPANSTSDPLPTDLRRSARTAHPSIPIRSSRKICSNCNFTRPGLDSLKGD